MDIPPDSRPAGRNPNPQDQSACTADERECVRKSAALAIGRSFQNCSWLLREFSPCRPQPPPHFAPLRRRQNELTPNQPNVTVKQTAMATLPDVVFPCVKRTYSRTSAMPPITAKHRKTKPVTSSQSCPRTILKSAPLAR